MTGVVTTLSGSPSLGPRLALGALRSPFKRPRPGAVFSGTGDRLVLPGLRVDLARLAAYERVCAFPTGEDALPLTYPHVLGFPLAMRIMSGRDFPLPLLGLVHTSIEITRRTALAATATYELTVYVDRLAPHRKGTEAVVVTELRADPPHGTGHGPASGGEPVWTSTSTYLARHRTEAEPAAGHATPPADQAVPAPGQPTHAAGRTTPAPDPSGPAPDQAAATAGRTPPAPGRAASEQAASEQAASEQAGPLPGRAEPGLLPVLDEWRLASDVGRRYGAASGDRNPIHLHALTARLFGFPRAIAHGMWTVARCLAAHGVPPAVRVRAEFRAPVLLPGTVVLAADGSRFELRGTGEAGRVHVSGRVDPLGDAATGPRTA
ncbi:MaoC/PaaZ C-terminal domain-containing protein [Streptomyces scabiei]|uniref:MaoC/PaaZ C-terminal domain-containing protein n=1 Tax=Streptomyces scabiei TaxID=1930 RepID=UPI0029A63EC9|nr:MaoC/PaaZ C-terminal domain-containing protein [Streptomyces scabiei]